MTPELHRPVALDRVGQGGLTFEVEAAAGELATLAIRLRLPTLAVLRCSFKLRRVAPGIIGADGHLTAELTQVCVVSLDEFPCKLAESFQVHFVPAGTEDDDPEPDAVDQIPYDGSVIDLGEAAVEQLALALDPYPHKPGAALDFATDAPDPHPLGALAALRPRS